MRAFAASHQSQQLPFNSLQFVASFLSNGLAKRLLLLLILVCSQLFFSSTASAAPPSCSLPFSVSQNSSNNRIQLAACDADGNGIFADANCNVSIVNTPNGSATIPANGITDYQALLYTPNAGLLELIPSLFTLVSQTVM